MGEDSPEERLRLRLRELGLPVNGRRSDDISLRKLSQAMGINLQHENGNRKVKDDLVEALVSALLSEVPVLANFHASYVEASLKDLRQIRDSLSGQAEQSGELRERLSKLSIKDQRDHVVTLRDLSRSLELPLGSSMKKVDYVQQILTALLAEVPAIASVDDAKTALVDASLRELLALRDGLAGQASQRQELESRLDQFNVRGRSSDVVTLIDLCRSLGMATKQQGRYMSGGVLKRQIVEFLLRGSLDAAKKASVDTTLQELRRVRDGVEEHAARRGKLKRCLKNVGFQHQAPDVVVLQDLCRALELPIAKSDGGGLTRPELEEQIVVSLLAEVVVPSRHVDQSCFGLAMELCRLFDGSQWDVDAAVRQVCDTVQRCACVGAVLTGTEEENLLGRHQGFEYWVEQLVRLLPGFLQYTRMLRDSLPSDVPDTFRVFPTNFVGDRSKDDGLCRGAKCLAFALAVEFCEEQRREKWCKLFGTEDAVKLGSRFCLILEHLAAEDHRAVDDDVPCLDYDRFVYCF